MLNGRAEDAGQGRGLRCRVIRVTTVAQLETVARLRWTVFSEAMGFGLELAPSMREINGFDVCPEANHFIAYVGDEAVGSLRLILPSASLAARHGCAIGLPMALDVGFGVVPAPCLVAELGRSAVRRPYRGSPAIGHLMRAAYLISRSAGMTHWAAGSLTATDDPTDASILDLLLSRRHRRSALTEIWGDSTLPKGYAPRRSLFDATQRLWAARADVSTISLPRSLSFHLLCGARVAGNAYFDRKFCEFLVPLIVDLDDYSSSPFGRRYCQRAPIDRARIVPCDRLPAL